MVRGVSRSWDDALIVAYLDGELPPAEAARVETILRDDPEAAEIARLMRLGGQAARGAFAGALSDPMPASVTALTSPRAEARPTVRPPDFFRWLGLAGWRGLAFAGLAAVLAFVVGVAVPRSGDPSDGTVRPAGGPPPAIDEEAIGAELVTALETAPDGSVLQAGPQRIRFIGPVDTGFVARCRSFQVDGTARVDGVACRGADGSWSLLTVQPPGATLP